MPTFYSVVNLRRVLRLISLISCFVSSVLASFCQNLSDAFCFIDLLLSTFDTAPPSLAMEQALGVIYFTSSICPISPDYLHKNKIKFWPRYGHSNPLDSHIFPLTILTTNNVVVNIVQYNTRCKIFCR